ncbi:uncharacterized protein [Euphorbia lathyris]|uniref:uncharacterized protein n=1 Tax=Euphorbia lathyris TaxID=212925 RepID=UPI003313AE1C
MGIQTNGKISLSSFSSGIEVHHNPHLCPLNQSPWDVISFSPDPDFDFQACLRQFGRNSRFDTIDNSNGSAPSIDRTVNNSEAEAVEKEEKVLGDNEEKGIENSDNRESNKDKKNEQVESMIRDLKIVEPCPKNDDSGCDGDGKGLAGLRRSQRRAAKKKD